MRKAKPQLRTLRVTKWLSTTPAIGVCTACAREFKSSHVVTKQNRRRSSQSSGTIRPPQMPARRRQLDYFLDYSEGLDGILAWPMRSNFSASSRSISRTSSESLCGSCSSAACAANSIHFSRFSCIIPSIPRSSRPRHCLMSGVTAAISGLISAAEGDWPRPKDFSQSVQPCRKPEQEGSDLFGRFRAKRFERCLADPGSIAMPMYRLASLIGIGLLER
jgi:hypothetical protein